MVNEQELIETTSQEQSAEPRRQAEPDDRLPAWAKGQSRPFAINNPYKQGIRRLLFAAAAKVIERVSHLNRVEAIYQAATCPADPKRFPSKLLEVMNIQCDVDEAALARIPRTGPVVVVANHPFGGIEGMVLDAVLRPLRPDVKLLANYLLGRMPEIGELMILVNPYSGPEAAAANLRPMKQCLSLLRSGGCMGVFPAGEVAHLRRGSWQVEESQWQASIGRLIRRSEATVVPVHFAGRNSWMFQLAGLIHERGRTLLLPRSLADKKGCTIRMAVGRPIPPGRLARFGDDQSMMDYLRMLVGLLGVQQAQEPARSRVAVVKPEPAERDDSRSTALAGSDSTGAAGVESFPRGATSGETPTQAVAMVDGSSPQQTAVPAAAPRNQSPLARIDRKDAGQQPIAPAVDPATLLQQIKAIPPEQVLHLSASYRVVAITASQAPAVMEELGRLREVTFREVGEGIGKASDLDEFDAHYTHLILWDERLARMIGAYRLGLTDHILPRYGVEGFYSRSLFAFPASLIHQIEPAIELGRSFIRLEYQKSFAPLHTLWKSINSFIALNPHYRRTFGPVSITNDYQPLSRLLMLTFLKEHASDPNLESMVKPNHPPRLDCPRNVDLKAFTRIVTDLEDVSELIEMLEPDQKGVPVLLRQYMKFNAKLLGFSIDPEFSNVIDGFIVADLPRSKLRILEHYLGRKEAAAYLELHKGLVVATQ